MHYQRSTRGREIGYGILLLGVLIGFGIFRYPAVLREGGTFNVVLSLSLLSLYGLTSWRIGRVTAGDAHTALRQGVGIGLILAAVMMIHLTVEYFVNLPAPWNAIVSLGLFPILFFAFGCAGFRGAVRSRHWGLGILASVWSAMLCMVLLCIYGFLINFLFMAHMETILRSSPEFLRSGMHDMSAFTVVNSLEACTSHMIIAPFLALIFGGLGGAAGKGFASRRVKSPRGEDPTPSIQQSGRAEFCV